MLSDISFLPFDVVPFGGAIIIAIAAFVVTRLFIIDNAAQKKLDYERDLLQMEDFRKRDREDKIREEAQIALQKTVVEVRRAAIEHYQPIVTSNSIQGFEQKIRDAHTTFTRSGPGLTVRGCLLATGWLLLEWALDPLIRRPATIRCMTGLKCVGIWHQVTKGVYTDVFEGGYQYQFAFQLKQGDGPFEESVRFFLSVPTDEEWNRRIVDTDSEDWPRRQAEIAKRIKRLRCEEQLWEQGRQEAHQEIDTSAASDAEKRRRKAMLDAQIIKERDAEEE